MAKLPNPSKVDPYWLPTSVVVEKPTGEFGVFLEGVTDCWFNLSAATYNFYPVASWNKFPGDCRARRTVSEVFSNSLVGGVKSAV